MNASYTTMDEALERLSAFGPDLRNGMTSHAPMAVEALCALGRPRAVPAWLDKYIAGMAPRPAAQERITQDTWRASLSRFDRTTDWSLFLEEELRNDPWRVVLDRWIDRLAPGLCAAATHGIIRVGHAARSLAQAESPWRVRELAEGLGYLAATYQELPTSPSARAGAMSPRQAIRHVAVMPPERRTFAGSIVSSLVGLNDFPEFVPAADLVDASGDLGVLVDDLAEAFAQVFLANAHDVLTTIVFVHGVTSVAALRNIVPHVGEATARRAARYVWQAGCGLYSTFANDLAANAETEADVDDVESLVDRAVAHADDHVIKFTEACLAMHARRPSEIFPTAIQRAMRRLPAA